MYISDFLAAFVSSMKIIKEEHIKMAFKHFNEKGLDQPIDLDELKKWSKTKSLKYTNDQLNEALKEIEGSSPLVSYSLFKKEVESYLQT